MKGFVLSLLKASLPAAVVAVALFFGADQLLAQGGGGTQTVTFTPIVDFSNVFDSITSSVGPLVAGAIGLGLGLWGVMFMFSIIKRMGRG